MFDKDDNYVVVRLEDVSLLRLSANVFFIEG